MNLNTPSMCGTKITTGIALSGNLIPQLPDTDSRDNLEDLNELTIDSSAPRANSG